MPDGGRTVTPLIVDILRSWMDHYGWLWMLVGLFGFTGISILREIHG